MENKKKVQEYFKDKYYNKSINYKAILSKISLEENINRNNLLKTVATIIITLLGTTSIVFASTKIYNKYIKKQNELESLGLFATEEGVFSSNFVMNNMILADEYSELYYQIITNKQEYSKYREKVNELPEMSNEDFDDSFLIIMGNLGATEPHLTDLVISNIDADETTIYVTMKQKENPNYENYNKTWYAVVDKILLRSKLEINIDFNTNIKNPNFVSLDSIPDDYSTEDALKDGCFVEEDYRILSENKYALDELIEKSKKGEESFIRIYSKAVNYNYIRIIDLEFDGRIFIMNGKILGTKNIDILSFRYLTKRYFPEDNTYSYGFNSIDRSIDAQGFLIVYLD